MIRPPGICALYPLLSSENNKLMEIRHFSGFSLAGRTDTNEEWYDKYYVLFRLAKPSPETTDLAKDTTGWTW